MKKLILTALAILVSASFTTASAGDKKKKEKVVEPEVKVVTLNNSSDSISYAAGMRHTDGLLPYIQQQFSVDTTYMANFIEGFKATASAEITEEMKAYLAGQQIAMMVNQRMLQRLRDQFKEYKDSVNEEIFNEGFINAINHDYSLMSASAATALFKEASKEATEALNEASRKAGEDFLAENKGKEGVVTTESGLQYKVLVQGEGNIPTEDDEVTVKYEGKLIDGTVFDSSYKRPGETAKFRPNQVIKGWTEALMMMPVGSKWELYIPQELGYGARQSGNIKPYSALIFTIELVSAEPAKKPNSNEAVISPGGKVVK